MSAVPLSQVAVHLRPKTTSPSPPAPSPAGTGVAGQRRHAVTLERRIGLGHKIAVRPIAEGEAVSASTARSSASPARTSPPATTSTSTTSGPTPSSATTPSAATARRRPPPAEPRYLHGLRPRRRPLRHAQLHRHHQHRQLLGQHEQVHLRAASGDRPARSSIPTSTAWWPITHKAGLRHAVRRPRPQPARPHAGRLRQASQRRRLHPRRPRLRDRAGDPPDRGPGADPAQRLAQEAAGPDASRSAAASARRSRPACGPSPSCCRGSTTCGGRSCRPSKIDPRHQLRRLRRQQRRDGQPGPRRRLRPARRRRAAPASSARRRKSTGPSIC